MARSSKTLSAQNTNVKICNVVKPENADLYVITVCVSGTFGGGTVTISISHDGGTTLLPLSPLGLAPAQGITSNQAYIYAIGNAENNVEAPGIYASIGAATDPSLTIVAYDNN